jgi:hypothetical protein
MADKNVIQVDCLLQLWDYSTEIRWWRTLSNYLDIMVIYTAGYFKNNLTERSSCIML